MTMGPVTRIDVPAWAHIHAHSGIQMQEGFCEEKVRAVLEHRDAFLARLHAAVESYLRTMSFDDGFPRRDRLTGEYYIDSERYTVATGQFFDRDGTEIHLRHRARIKVHCLQWPRLPHYPEANDYLGLDVDMVHDPVAKRFYVWGCDSSVI